MLWFSRKPNIEKLKQKNDVDGLINLLTNSDKNVTRGAIFALGEIGDKKALNSFQSLLKHDNASIRDATVIALRNFKYEPRVVEMLLSALNDKDEEVIYDAARSLQQVGDFSAIKDLNHINQKTNHVQIKKESEIALRMIYYRLNTEKIISLLGSKDEDTIRAILHVIDLLAHDKPQEFNIVPLIKGLEDSNPQSRISAACALQIAFKWNYNENYWVRPLNFKNEAIKSLILLLKDSNALVRAGAIGALSRSRDQQVVHHLVAALNDPDPYVRIHATQGLGEFKDSWVVEPLISQLGDSETTVRYYACVSLGKLLDSRAIIPLCRMINDSDHNVVHQAYIALEKFKENIRAGTEKFDREITNEILCDALTSENYESRSAAAKLLLYYGSNQSVAPLLKALMDKCEGCGVKQNALRKLSAFDNPEIYNAVLTSLHDPDFWVRLYSIEYLMKKGNADAIIPLQNIVNDNNQEKNIREEAQEAIVKIRERS